MQESANLLCCCCLCMLQCVMQCIGSIIKTLNHFSVIVMSVTGESFWDSAKSGSVIFFSQFPLFAIVSSVESIVNVAGVISTAILPTFAAYMMGEYFGFSSVTLLMAVVVVFLVNLSVSSIFMATFSEAMTSLFVFYVLEMKMVEYGIKPRPLYSETLTIDQLMGMDLRNYPPLQIMTMAQPIVAGYVSAYQ